MRSGAAGCRRGAGLVRTAAAAGGGRGGGRGLVTRGGAGGAWGSGAGGGEGVPACGLRVPLRLGVGWAGPGRACQGRRRAVCAGLGVTVPVVALERAGMGRGARRAACQCAQDGADSVRWRSVTGLGGGTRRGWGASPCLETAGPGLRAAASYPGPFLACNRGLQGRSSALGPEVKHDRSPLWRRAGPAQTAAARGSTIRPPPPGNGPSGVQARLLTVTVVRVGPSEGDWPPRRGDRRHTPRPPLALARLLTRMPRAGPFVHCTGIHCPPQRACQWVRVGG